MIRYCIQCGNKLKDNARFCPKCGQAIDDLDSVVAEEIENKPDLTEEEIPAETRRENFGTENLQYSPNETSFAQENRQYSSNEASPAQDRGQYRSNGTSSAQDRGQYGPNGISSAQESGQYSQNEDSSAQENGQYMQNDMLSDMDGNAAQSSGSHVDDAAAGTSRKKKKKWLLIIPVILLVAVIAAVAIPFSIQKNKEKKYAEAYKLYTADDYENALTIYKGLGDYEESASYVEKCQKGLDYNDAVDLMDDGNYKDAADIFESLEDYEDSLLLEKKCLSNYYYEEGKAKYDDGNFEDAIEDLERVDAVYVPEAEDLEEECQNEIDYAEAKALLKDGNKVEAYEAFTLLGDFKDSEDMADSCTTDYPSNGETYHNDAYVSDSVSLEIVGPSNGILAYVKIYAGDDLVSCAFIDQDSSVTINLPAGSYTLKTAYGLGPWFGADDMFGDQGIYQLLKFDGDNTVKALEANYAYTLTLQASEDEPGDAIGDEEVDREDF